VKVGGLGAAGHLPSVAHVDFVLKDQFQKLGMAEPVGGGLLQTDA
jgi:hypothetical protein